jgi:hypothetical protein
MATSPKYPWQFVPRRAIDLVFRKPRYNRYLLEREINAYLLFLWALWPSGDPHSVTASSAAEGLCLNTRKLRGAARCIGAMVALSRNDILSDDEECFLLGEPLETPMDLVEQVSTDWFSRFDRAYLRPLGGLMSQITEGENGRYYRQAISKDWEESLLVRDIARYFCGAARLHHDCATQKTLTSALRANIFRRNDYRQRKRVITAISDSTITNAAQNGLSTAVLLFAIERMCPRILSIDLSDLNFLAELSLVIGAAEEMRDALLYYKHLMEVLRPVVKGIPTLRRWEVLDVPAPVPAGIIAEVEKREVFSPEEIETLSKLNGMAVVKPPHAGIG